MPFYPRLEDNIVFTLISDCESENVDFNYDKGACILQRNLS